MSPEEWLASQPKADQTSTKSLSPEEWLATQKDSVTSKAPTTSALGAFTASGTEAAAATPGPPPPPPTTPHL